MKVKICGIKSFEDAIAAIELGADAIGLLVGQKHESKDFITKEEAKKIVDKLPPFCSSVLVTHIDTAKEIIELAKYVNMTTIQLHSDISIEEIEKIKKELPNVKLLKCIHVIDMDSVKEALKYQKYVDAILLDTYNEQTNQVGGTGLTHDWKISKQIIQECDIKVVLAGGLNPNNVKDVKIELNPYGVDVNSGVKNTEGYKDYIKLEEFIKNSKK